MNFLLRRHLRDLLIVDLLGIGIVHRTDDVRIEIGIAQSAARVKPLAGLFAARG